MVWRWETENDFFSGSEKSVTGSSCQNKLPITFLSSNAPSQPIFFGKLSQMKFSRGRLLQMMPRGQTGCPANCSINKMAGLRCGDLGKLVRYIVD